jgi:hypothetical protein
MSLKTFSSVQNVQFCSKRSVLFKTFSPAAIQPLAMTLAWKHWQNGVHQTLVIQFRHVQHRGKHSRGYSVRALATAAGPA